MLSTKRSLIAGIALVAVASASVAIAAPAGEREGGTLYVVQEHKFMPKHEVRLAGGLLPQDAFWKGYTVDLGYRYNFNKVVAWEAFRFAASRNLNTDLKDTLLEEFPEPVGPDPFEEVRFMVTSHAVITPLYGKFALFNRTTIRQELYLMGGAGAINWTLDSESTGWRPTVDFGGGLRFWVAKNIALNLEAVENVYQDRDGSLDDMVYLSMGASIVSLAN